MSQYTRYPAVSGGGGGSGTVTSVSVSSANGVSGSVANATTTPAISLTLGDITPDSVAAVGTVAGSNLSGSNTGDQTITLTSHVTGTGTGTFATTIANNVITNAMVNSSAAIVDTKLATIATSGKVSNSATTATATNTASTILLRDSNSNCNINAMNEGITSTATAAGTTTLTTASTPQQVFTGTTTQTVVLPDATTLQVGRKFQIFNRSTGTVTVNFNDGSLAQAILGGTRAEFIVLTNGTSAGTWYITNPQASTNVASSLVLRDSSGNFSAGGITLSTPLVTTSGGTGTGTYTSGDILYSSATNTLSKLAIGSPGYALKSFSSLPEYSRIIDARRESFLFEDWVSPNAAGSNAWNSVLSNSGNLSLTTGESSAPGILRFDSTTTNNAQSAVRLNPINFQFSGGTWDFEWRVRFPVLSTASEEYIARIGFGDTPSADQVDGVYFEYDRSISGDFWRIKTANNSSRTVSVTSTAIVANTWYKVRCQVNAAGSSVTYFVDDVSVGTIITNIPTASSRVCAPLSTFFKTVGTTSTVMDVDYYWHHFVFTTPR